MLNCFLVFNCHLLCYAWSYDRKKEERYRIWYFDAKNSRGTQQRKTSHGALNKASLGLDTVKVIVCVCVREREIDRERERERGVCKTGPNRIESSVQFCSIDTALKYWPSTFECFCVFTRTTTRPLCKSRLRQGDHVFTVVEILGVPTAECFRCSPLRNGFVLAFFFFFTDQLLLKGVYTLAL